jgi:hypothetical protein
VTAPVTSDLGIVHGYRSGLEAALERQLRGAGLPVLYEEMFIPFRVDKSCKYTPDFILPNGIVVESKGRFITADRQKHLLIKAQHPELDIRFVFSRSASRIAKTSKTTYAKWCQTKGFKYADAVIPTAWLNEPVGPVSLAKILQLFESQGKVFPA